VEVERLNVPPLSILPYHIHPVLCGLTVSHNTALPTPPANNFHHENIETMSKKFLWTIPIISLGVIGLCWVGTIGLAKRLFFEEIAIPLTADFPPVIARSLKGLTVSDAGGYTFYLNNEIVLGKDETTSITPLEPTDRFLYDSQRKQIFVLAEFGSKRNAVDKTISITNQKEIMIIKIRYIYLKNSLNIGRPFTDQDRVKKVNEFNTIVRKAILQAR
jgi:hypothetical protein